MCPCLILLPPPKKKKVRSETNITPKNCYFLNLRPAILSVHVLQNTETKKNSLSYLLQQILVANETANQFKKILNINLFLITTYFKMLVILWPLI